MNTPGVKLKSGNLVRAEHGPLTDMATITVTDVYGEYPLPTSLELEVDNTMDATLVHYRIRAGNKYVAHIVVEDGRTLLVSCQIDPGGLK